jgi:hypothetical protein
MFEIESKNPNEITIKTATKTVTIDFVNGVIMADLAVGEIAGPGEFEIGEATIRGISVAKHAKTIYDVEVGGVHVGIIGDFDENLDELGISDILCTSSVKAIKDINPKIIVATGNIDGMVTELKLSSRVEKKIKIKKIEDLPAVQEVITLN